MKNFIKIAAVLFSTFLLIGCAEDGGSGSAATTFSISGGLGVGGASPAVASKVSQKLLDVSQNVNAQAAACSDGNIYKIYCVSFAENPTAASGDVVCAGGATGTYTVSGLPLNTPIGCFVQVSQDGASYSTAGTIELTQQGSMGGNSNITAEGDMGINITIATDGRIASEVTVDARKAPSSIANTDPALFNGIYKMTCDNASGGTLFSQGRCKCFIGEDSYGLDYANQDECMADPNGAGNALSNVAMFVDINLYNAVAGSDITENGVTYITAGSTVQAVTIWAAADGSTTTRAGGEGLGQFESDMGLTFSDGQAATAISWSASADLDSNVVTTASTIAAVPANNATVGTWVIWLQGIVDSGIANSEIVCTGRGFSGSEDSADAECLQYVADNILENVSGATIPRIHFQPRCDYNGCSSTANEGRIWIEGVEFDYDFVNWSGNQSATAAIVGGSGASPRNRFVFEQWHNFPAGGGGFTQKSGHNIWYPCTSGVPSGNEVQHTSCTSPGDGLECFMDEELGIKMLPTVTAGAYNMVFETRNTIFGGQFHLGGSINGTVFSAEAADLCRQAAHSDGAFMSTAVKQ